MPYCPNYLSQPAHSKRTSRDCKLQKKEIHLKAAIEASEKVFGDERIKNNLSSISDLKQKLKIATPWQLMVMDGEEMKGVSICHVSHLQSTSSHIDCSLHVNEDMILTAFMHSVKLDRVGTNAMPLHMNSLQQIYEVCDTIAAMPAFGSIVTSKTIDLTIAIIITLLFSLKQTSTKFTTVISFIIEQLQLLSKRSYVYSSEFLIFASIFQNLSPTGYRFLRSSGKFILPCLTTIRKVTLYSSVSLSNEQSDDNFMFHIKNKYKALQSSDKTVCLLVDEIHLAPFFDYKGGNLVGAAYDSTKAATSAFVFMITSVFFRF